MTRKEQIYIEINKDKCYADCPDDYEYGFICGVKWSDKNPKSDMVNKQEFIEKTISYFTPILKTYCNEECVKELIDGFVNSLEK